MSRRGDDAEPKSDVGHLPFAGRGAAQMTRAGDDAVGAPPAAQRRGGRSDEEERRR